jgi:hypothetical protein
VAADVHRIQRAKLKKSRNCQKRDDREQQIRLVEVGEGRSLFHALDHAE